MMDIWIIRSIATHRFGLKSTPYFGALPPKNRQKREKIDGKRTPFRSITTQPRANVVQTS